LNFPARIDAWKDLVAAEDLGFSTRGSMTRHARRSSLLKVHERRMIYVKPGEESFLTRELIRSFSITAPREEIIARIKELEAAGLQEIVFSLSNDDAQTPIEELSREIVARY
jgi:hypothetical protein